MVPIVTLPWKTVGFQQNKGLQAQNPSDSDACTTRKRGKSTNNTYHITDKMREDKKKRGFSFILYADVDE
jgi:hypothetical protein